MRLLLADDDPVARTVLQARVARLGHDCTTAEDGLDAWERYREWSPDVVISDWSMPGLIGPELCRRIREHATSDYTYLILLTALEGDEHLLEAMHAGVDDFMTKPSGPRELEARLVAAARVNELHRRLTDREDKLTEANRRLGELARLDELTGVGNRLRMREELAATDARSERYGTPYSLVIFDVDHFKRYNDVVGHQAGDDALREVAQAIAALCRSADAIYRYGGEELLVFLPEQPPRNAEIAAERMRGAVERLALHHPARSAGGVVTVSAGLASRTEGRPEPLETVLARADTALYEAKRLGRNRVVSAEAPQPSATDPPGLHVGSSS